MNINTNNNHNIFSSKFNKNVKDNYKLIFLFDLNIYNQDFINKIKYENTDEFD
jgi:hypothetical protein